MLNNLKVLIGALLLAAALGGCDEGKYNDLKCDASYKDECIDYDYYTTCQNNSIVTIKCPDANYCFMDANGESKCVPARDENAPVDDNAQGTDASAGNICTEGSTRCEGNFVQTCVTRQWISAAKECANGCAEGACL
ncbi:MAG: hypothetical protein J6A01_08720 [Proteobacteria bacterium]|nr:hypothetical protein [Pseudomonadota bacterium]